MLWYYICNATIRVYPFLFQSTYYKDQTTYFYKETL